jgi:hypothetical protein
MAGIVLRVIPRRLLDFSDVSSGTGQAQEHVLAQGIDVSSWRHVAMMVRTHVNSIGAGSSKIEINAYAEGRSSEEPGVLFASKTPLATSVISVGTAPHYDVVILPENIGSLLTIAAKGTRTAANGLAAWVSIDLSMKSA